MISRPDISLKVKEVQHAVELTKQKRISYFANSKYLQHLLPQGLLRQYMNNEGPLSPQSSAGDKSASFNSDKQSVAPTIFSRQRSRRSSVIGKQIGKRSPNQLSVNSSFVTDQLDKRQNPGKWNSIFSFNDPNDHHSAIPESSYVTSDEESSFSEDFETPQPADVSDEQDTLPRDLNLNLRISGESPNKRLSKLEKLLDEQQKERLAAKDRQREVQEAQQKLGEQNLQNKLDRFKYCSYVLIAYDIGEGQIPQPKAYLKKFFCIDSGSITIYNDGKDAKADHIIHFNQIVKIFEDKYDIQFIYKNEDFDFINHRFRATSYEDYLKWQGLLKSFSRQGDIDIPDFTRRTSALLYQPEIYQDYKIFEENLQVASNEENKLEISQQIDFGSSASDGNNSFDLELDRSGSISAESVRGPITEERQRTLTAAAQAGQLAGLANLLTKGGIFVKYGRWGRPKLRHIHVTQDLKEIKWRPLNKAAPKAKASITTADIIDVDAGRDNKNFKRFKRPENNDISFSIKFKKRTLDLEICKENTIDRATWMNAFQHLGDGMLKRADVTRYVMAEKDKN